MTDSQENRTALPSFQPHTLIFTLFTVVIIALLALPVLSLSAQETAETAEATAEATESADAATADAAATTEVGSGDITEIVADANAFLELLDDAQLEAVMFDFNDETQRNNWSNFPTGLYTRAGLSYGSLTEEQRTAEMTLLQSVLSQQGYEKLIGAMTADEILRQSGSQVAGATFGFAEYYISFLGTPSETAPWILQYGGHHFALNITFVGSTTVMTPSHTGCQPCTYTIDAQTIQVLGDEYAKALALINALDATQQDTAMLDYSVTNLVLGPGEEERALEPEGLPGSEMTADQQAMLLDIMSEWVNIVSDEAAAPRMAELEANIADTYFAWSGDIGEDSTSYFRITGPTVLIEYAPQGDGGGGGGNGGGGPGGTQEAGGPPDGGFPGGQSTAEAGATEDPNATATETFELDLGDYTIIEDAGMLYHVHTIYRDPTNAYGAAVTGE
jgi:hypothetical protein